MPRKIVDTYPEVRITLGPRRGSSTTPWSRNRAQVEADDFWALIKRHVLPHYQGEVDHEVKVVEEAQCEHCRMLWTENSADYNGGCCDRDNANDPDRLKEMAKVAEAISGETFYRFDEDGRRGRIPVNWPDQFGAAVAEWLEKGRPAAAVVHLLHMAAHVEESGWCTVWSDPGPSGCSLARLPDMVTRDDRPEVLAADLRSLIEDMELTPAKERA